MADVDDVVDDVDVDVTLTLDEHDQVQSIAEPTLSHNFMRALIDPSRVSVQSHETVGRCVGFTTMCLLVLGLGQICATGLCYLGHGFPISEEQRPIGIRRDIYGDYKIVFRTDRELFTNLHLICLAYYIWHLIFVIVALCSGDVDEGQDSANTYLAAVFITGLFGGDPHCIPHVDTPMPRPWTLHMLTVLVMGILYPTPVDAHDRKTYQAYQLGPPLLICVLMAYMHSYLGYTTLVYLVCSTVVTGVLMQLIIGRVVTNPVAASACSVIADVTIRSIILYLADPPADADATDEANNQPTTPMYYQCTATGRP